MAQNCLFQNLCRICTNHTDGISIYSKEGKEFSLEEKINRFLSIQVKEEDKLPKMVCLLCRNKLESIQKFSVMATNSQTKLLECLKSQKNIETEAETNAAEEIRDFLPGNAAYDKDIKGSLLHSILTKGHISNTSDDITEMEVTIDPMLFFEEDAETECDKDDVISPKTIVTSEREFNSTQIFEVKPYQCSLCPRGFNSDLSLKNHLWNHLPSKKILFSSDLNRMQATGGLTNAAIRHRRIYNSQCLCQECGRIYPTKSTLRAHQVTHSNLRPHKCSLCDKTFKRNQDLKFHINQHTGERPYRCPYCPKAFASSGNCFSHRKRMHSKQLARDKKLSRH